MPSYRSDVKTLTCGKLWMMSTVPSVERPSTTICCTDTCFWLATLARQGVICRRAFKHTVMTEIFGLKLFTKLSSTTNSAMPSIRDLLAQIAFVGGGDCVATM